MRPRSPINWAWKKPLPVRRAGANRAARGCRRPQGMKKYVWSETFVEGGKPFTGKLAHPPSNTGAFQNMGVHDVRSPRPKVLSPFRSSTPTRWSSPIAGRQRDVPLESLHAKITASGGSPDVAMLTDGDLEKTTKLPIPAVGESSWIQYEFAEPQTMRVHHLRHEGPGSDCALAARASAPRRKSLEASDDGQNFRIGGQASDGGAPETYCFVSRGDGQVSSASCSSGRRLRHLPDWAERHRSIRGHQDRPAAHRLRNRRVGCCIRERA